MTVQLFLSRASLRSDAPITALAPILVPPDHDHRLAAAHRLLWTLFSDGPDRRRDFLWRQERSGKSAREAFFYILSMRPPTDPHGLFDLETKLFAPMLAEGDRLGFILRANAVVTRKNVAGRPRRHDVVMDHLHKLDPSARTAQRRSAIDEAGRAWLDDQAQRHGFLVGKGLRVDGYHTAKIERPGHRSVSFSTLDFSGVLTIVQPPLFGTAIGQGFGKAKSFGCGLMLIRRV
jgi:CRISPR system Cascade subunit CasE